MAFFYEFQHLKIQLEDIKSATDNFADDNLIGKGGFGKVYKGTISHSKGRSMVAFKRLDSIYGQGNSEFWREIMMLSRYTHENLVSLLGYCDEGGEKILLYEHASNGSLDRHLSATALTWRKRLMICIEVAKGLSYLHDPKGTQQRVLHRDIKSANILLDDNWNAKVSDFGLSKIGPANQQYTALVSNLLGTPGYCDPLYMEMGLLTKESDVYSFGVVLFEVLCGRLCYEYSNCRYQVLVRMWKKSYKQNKLDEIIFHDLLQQMDLSSLKTFSDIAYLCLQKSLEERPTMAHIVKELEIALESQETYEKTMDSEEPLDYEGMLKTSVPPLIYASKEELDVLLSKGILLNGGKTWFSLNKKGEHIEMISAAESIGNIPLYDVFASNYNSRFAVAGIKSKIRRLKAHVRTQFLSPNVTYMVNIVFKFKSNDNTFSESTCLYLEYGLEGEKDRSTSYVAYPREDGWLMAELYQFTSRGRKFELKMQLGYHHTSGSLIVEGIEFRPLEKVIAALVEHEALEDEKVNMQPISDSDIYWEQKMPIDYEEIITQSKDIVQWTTKKELYFLLHEGFLINHSGEWFSLDKNGKKCYMLPAKAALVESEWAWKSLSESRFGEVAFNPLKEIRIAYENKFQMWSPQTEYASYLVYKLPENHSRFEAPVKVRDNSSPAVFWMIYLLCRQTPVIRPKVDQNTNNPLNIPKMRDLPQQRIDGWMEVKVWDFRTHYGRHVDLTIYFPSSLDGLIVQGIQFKPY